MTKWGKPLLITSGVVDLAVRRDYKGVSMFLEDGIMIYPTIDDVVNSFAALATRYTFLSKEVYVVS